MAAAAGAPAGAAEEGENIYEGEGHSRCAVCCSICQLICPPVPHRIVSKLAFLPPEPSSYSFDKVDGQDVMRLDECGPEEVFTPPGKLHLLRERTRRGSTVAAYFIEMPSPRFTILFSHGNAVDIGQMAVFLATLASEQNCSICAYDYSGYGLSTGAAREANMYADIDCIWDTLTTKFGVPSTSIVIYGQSIGTVASVYLASRLGRADAARASCAGVILHSPLMSGLRVLRPKTRRTVCCDPFPSIDRIKHINSPTLIIHGDEDEIIHVSHGYELYGKCAVAVEPLFVPSAGHNDLELFPEFHDRIARFLLELESGGIIGSPAVIDTPPAPST